MARQVDLGHGNGNLLAGLYDGGGFFDEAVGELANVNEAVLVDADVDEGAEGGDVGHDTGQLHARLEILGFVDAGLKGEGFKFLAGVAAGFGEFGNDVSEGR